MFGDDKQNVFCCSGHATTISILAKHSNINTDFSNYHKNDKLL